MLSKAILVGAIHKELGTEGTIQQDMKGEEVAETAWKVVQCTPSVHRGVVTTVDLYPKTGRKHQLRKHTSQVLGAPIVGDALYSAALPDNCVRKNRGILLRALEIHFQHPETGKKIHVQMEEPYKFEAYRVREQMLYDKVTNGGPTSSVKSGVGSEDTPSVAKAAVATTTNGEEPATAAHASTQSAAATTATSTPPQLNAKARKKLRQKSIQRKVREERKMRKKNKKEGKHVALAKKKETPL